MPGVLTWLDGGVRWARDTWESSSRKFLKCGSVLLPEVEQGDSVVGKPDGTGLALPPLGHGGFWQR